MQVTVRFPPSRNSTKVNEELVPVQLPMTAPLSVTVPLGSMTSRVPWTVQVQTPPVFDRLVGTVLPPTAQLYVPLHGESGRYPPLLDVVVVPDVVPVVPELPVPVVVLFPLHADEQVPFTQLLNDVATLMQFVVSRGAQFEIQVESLH
jgi:hypothetical protein